MLLNVIICIDYCHNSLIVITFYLAKSDHIMRLPLYILNIFNERVEFMILTHRWLGSRWLTYFFLGQRPWNVNGCFLKCEMCFAGWWNLLLLQPDSWISLFQTRTHTHTLHTLLGVNNLPEKLTKVCGARISTEMTLENIRQRYG